MGGVFGFSAGVTFQGAWQENILVMEQTQREVTAAAHQGDTSQSAAALQGVRLVHVYVHEQ